MRGKDHCEFNETTGIVTFSTYNGFRFIYYNVGNCEGFFWELKCGSNGVYLNWCFVFFGR